MDQATLFKQASQLMGEALDRSRALTLSLVEQGGDGDRDIGRARQPIYHAGAPAQRTRLCADSTHE